VSEFTGSLAEYAGVMLQSCRVWQRWSQMQYNSVTN